MKPHIFQVSVAVSLHSSKSKGEVMVIEEAASYVLKLPLTGCFPGHAAISAASSTSVTHNIMPQCITNLQLKWF